MAGQTNIGGTFSINSTTGTPAAANSDLNLAAFQALPWEVVPNLGSMGDTGVDQNIVNFDTWDRLSQKQKGMAIGKDVEVTFTDETGTPLAAMKLAGDITDTNNFAFRIVWPDLSEEYFRGVVAAPSYGKGGGEDFKVVTFTIGINQESVFGP